MFLLKKILTSLLYPSTLVYLILLAGLTLLWTNRKAKTAKILLTLGLLLQLILGYGFISDYFFRRFERIYPPLQDTELLKGTKWIVVLGGGICNDENLPLLSRLSAASLARLTEGIRLWRQIPESILLLSGGKVFNEISEALLMEETAIALGVNEKKILLEDNSRDTREQAVLIKEIVKQDKMVLITSAFHMPRSMLLFIKQGMKPIPCPADFQIRDKHSLDPMDYFPSPAPVLRNERFIKELLGLLREKIRFEEGNK